MCTIAQGSESQFRHQKKSVDFIGNARKRPAILNSGVRRAAKLMICDLSVNSTSSSAALSTHWIILPPSKKKEWATSIRNCTFCGFTVGFLTANDFTGWDSLDLSACDEKTQGTHPPNKTSLYITERAI